MRRAGNRRRSGGHHYIRQVEDGDQQNDGCEYAFSISDILNVSRDVKIPLKIGGLPVTMIIDSGASCNVIGRNVWEYLKAHEVKCVSSKAFKKLYSYGSNQPLQVGERVLCGVEFVVIENKGQALLGRESALL